MIRLLFYSFLPAFVAYCLYDWKVAILVQGCVGCFILLKDEV